MIFKQLENDLILLKPLEAKDFEALFAIASDKEIWTQHPNFNRYQRDEFAVYFRSLLHSNQPYLIIDKTKDMIVGATCYYEYCSTEKSIAIGYTFISKEYWGRNYNRQVKHLMILHAFEYIEKVIFHVRKGNIRSQKALEKIEARFVKEYPDPNSEGGIRLEYQIQKNLFRN